MHDRKKFGSSLPENKTQSIQVSSHNKKYEEFFSLKY